VQFCNFGGIHQFGYGRDLYEPDGTTLRQIGANWSRFTSTSMRVSRGVNDSSAQDVHVRIWVVQPYRVYLPLVLRNN